MALHAPFLFWEGSAPQWWFDQNERQLLRMLRLGDQCCLRPSKRVDQYALGCCEATGCGNCGRVWEYNFKDGHSADHHPKTELTEKQLRTLKKRRRLRRKRE